MAYLRNDEPQAAWPSRLFHRAVLAAACFKTSAPLFVPGGIPPSSQPVCANSSGGAGFLLPGRRAAGAPRGAAQALHARPSSEAQPKGGVLARPL